MVAFAHCLSNGLQHPPVSLGIGAMDLEVEFDPALAEYALDLGDRPLLGPGIHFQVVALAPGCAGVG